VSNLERFLQQIRALLQQALASQCGIDVGLIHQPMRRMMAHQQFNERRITNEVLCLKR
jgi:hypothetical protein